MGQLISDLEAGIEQFTVTATQDTPSSGLVEFAITDPNNLLTTTKMKRSVLGDAIEEDIPGFNPVSTGSNLDLCIQMLSRGQTVANCPDLDPENPEFDSALRSNVVWRLQQALRILDIDS